MGHLCRWILFSWYKNFKTSIPTRLFVMNVKCGQKACLIDTQSVQWLFYLTNGQRKLVLKWPTKTLSSLILILDFRKFSERRRWKSVEKFKFIMLSEIVRDKWKQYIKQTYCACMSYLIFSFSIEIHSSCAKNPIPSTSNKRNKWLQ